MKKLFVLIIVLLLCIYFIGCSASKSDSTTKEVTNITTQTEKETTKEVIYETKETEFANNIYKNTQYNFSFSLPESWIGYKILIDEWKGTPADSLENENLINGPLIYIRHPGWTSDKPRQDIPILIFTLSQWNSLQREEFNIGAAPIGPSELGKNNKYVFALPARYNFAYLEGYEEVEDILINNPLY